jgi:hypothetical protein
MFSPRGIPDAQTLTHSDIGNYLLDLVLGIHKIPSPRSDQDIDWYRGSGVVWKNNPVKFGMTVEGGSGMTVGDGGGYGGGRAGWDRGTGDGEGILRKGSGEGAFGEGGGRGGE